MASYDEDSFTDAVTLKDFAKNKGKSPKDFILETIVVSGHSYEDAVKNYNEIAKKYDAVLGVNEGISNIQPSFMRTPIGEILAGIRRETHYVIRGVGIKEKISEAKKCR